MQRRNFLKLTAIGTAIGMTGCVGGGDPRPPRKSTVFDEIKVEGEQLVVSLESQSRVTTLVDENTGAPVGFVGVAEAKGRGGRTSGRGYTSRGTRSAYRRAPKAGRHNRAKLYWGAYADEWYKEHEEEVDRVPTRIEEVGVARIPDYEEKEPGPGAVNWDRVYEDVKSGENLEVSLASVGIEEPGWYRVSSHLVSDGRDFGWESVDFLVEEDNGELNVERQWKVSPRL